MDFSAVSSSWSSSPTVASDWRAFSWRCNSFLSWSDCSRSLRRAVRSLVFWRVSARAASAASAASDEKLTSAPPPSPVASATALAPCPSSSWDLASSNSSCALSKSILHSSSWSSSISFSSLSCSLSSTSSSSVVSRSVFSSSSASFLRCALVSSARSLATERWECSCVDDFEETRSCSTPSSRSRDAIWEVSTAFSVLNPVCSSSRASLSRLQSSAACSCREVTLEMRSSASDSWCRRSDLSAVSAESCDVSSSLRWTSAWDTAAAAWLTTSSFWPSSSFSSSLPFSSSPSSSSSFSSSKLPVPDGVPPLPPKFLATEGLLASVRASAPMAYILTASWVDCSAPLDMKSNELWREAQSAVFFWREVSRPAILDCSRCNSAR
mmetsp:Transcript_16076/g.35005  ORF Transcript_16076/g.35005 Transcript_16076/m.35005 type:complete len:382 (+) Transcript_16076:2626-3771(+)